MMGGDPETNSPGKELRFGDAEVRVFPGVEGLGDAVARAFVTAARLTIAKRGRFAVALSGGSTPRAVNARIAEAGQALAWDRVHVFFGDERAVPPDHPDSNYRMARESLLARVPIPAVNVHRVRGEAGATRAAAEYEAELRAFFGPGPAPAFDLIFLGMGADGHTASLFPGTPAIQEKERWVVANSAENVKTERVTFALRVLNHAERVWFLVAGKDKAVTLAAVLQGESRAAYPSQLVHPQGELTWWTDEAAAELLAD